MADRQQKGEYFILKISTDAGTTYESVACLKDIKLNTTRNVIDNATFCNPSGKAPGKLDQSVSFSGVVFFEPVSGKTSGTDIYALIKAGTVFTWQILPVATPVTGDPTYTGTGFFSEYETTMQTADFVTFSAKIDPESAATQTIAT
jgi:predicted secreted protein